MVVEPENGLTAIFAV